MARKHAIVDREVATDHVSSGSSSILGQVVTLVVDVCGVLSVVYTDRASKAVAGTVCLEEGIRPVSPLAKACCDVNYSSMAWISIRQCRGRLLAYRERQR